MKGVARDRMHADILSSRAGSGRELPNVAGAGARGATRKHVRNDATGARASKTVMCEFMRQPVGDMRMHRSTLAPISLRDNRMSDPRAIHDLSGLPHWRPHA
jgi:hypothetical protein